MNCIDFPYMSLSNVTSSSARQKKRTDAPFQYCASTKRIDMHSSFKSLSSTRSGDKTRSSVFSGSRGVVCVASPSLASVTALSPLLQPTESDLLYESYFSPLSSASEAFAFSRLDVSDPGDLESDSPSSMGEEASYHYTSIALPSFAFDTQSDTLSLLSSETCSGAECLSHPHAISVQSGDVKNESQLLYRGRFHEEVSVHSPKTPSHLSSIPLHSVSSPSPSVPSHSSPSICSSSPSIHSSPPTHPSSPSTHPSSAPTQPRAGIKCKKPANKWTKEEDALLQRAVSQYGDCNWKYIAFCRCGEVV